MTGSAPSFWETLYSNKEFYENHFARSGLISSDGTIEEEAVKDIAKQHANAFRNEISDRTITSLIEYNAGLPEKKNMFDFKNMVEVLLFFIVAALERIPAIFCAIVVHEQIFFLYWNFICGELQVKE